MRTFGLTGGIATGKSTVADMFRRRGVPVLDADQVAREVVAPGQPALLEIAARFPGTVSSTGVLNRQALAERIFEDARERAALNAITHPRIAARVLEQAHALAQGGAPRVIYDAPLLFENGLERGMDGVVVVTASPELQLARLLVRSGLGPAQAQARIDSQMPLAEKVKRATWVIDNGDSLARTEHQVDLVLSAMTAMG